MTHFDPSELRDPHGRWSHGAREAALRGVVATGRAKVQTPSQFRHPSTGHAMGKTEIGDTFEQLFRMRGAAMLEAHFGHPYIEIAGGGSVGSAKGRTSRTTPLDFRLDHKFGGELKTLNARAANQKTAIKKEETARKRADVERQNLAPLLVVQVADMETSTVHVYAYRDFASKRVSQMEKVGSYTFSRRDFREAQTRTGHWGKRAARASQA